MTARRLVALVVLYSLARVGPAPGDAIDDIVSARMKEQGIPGLSLKVVRDGEVLKRQAYGLANVELKAPATAETIYEIGSITKSFTASLVMDLVEEGKIDLDAPISTYLTDLPDAWKAVTVRHLLNHTSGIKSYTGVGDFLKLARNDHTQREILAMVADKPLEFEPGTKWAYNNTGYYLLGMIVEKAGSRPFARQLTDRILEPLEMTATRPSNPRAIVPNRAAGYGKLLGVMFNRDPLTPTAAFSAGFLLSDVDDMTKWAAAQEGDAILNNGSRAAMITPTTLKDGSTQQYGFGWGVNSMRKHQHISHGGGTPGFSTLLAIYPDDKLTIVVLSNLGGADVAGIEKAIARHVLPDLSIADAPAIDAPEPETTARIREAITKVLGGEVPEAFFTPDFAKFLDSEEAKRVSRELARSGEMGSFDLIERTAKGGSTVLAYRAILGKAIYLLTVTLDGEGKISGLLAQKED